MIMCRNWRRAWALGEFARWWVVTAKVSKGWAGFGLLKRR